MGRSRFHAGDYVTIEEFIDRYGLAVVLEALADVCYDKAAHVEHAWQDAGLSKKWERAGKRIYSTARSKPVRALP